MEWVRAARNPWGEEVLLGLAWDVAWLVVVIGALFIVGHALFARRKSEEPVPSVDPTVAASVPAHVPRHSMSARISHWVLAASVLVLLGTAFVPMLGLQFAWVAPHWIAGLVLGVYVVYHLVDTLARLSWGKMWIGFSEIGESISRTRDFFSGREDPEKRPGKWGTENKIFHHVTGLAGLAVLVTGGLMMTRVDTWFWAANPYMLEISDADWGIVYVLHGVAAVGFVGLLMAHIYFALRPDKLWITRSMFKGWITRDEYLQHHSPERWPVARKGTAAKAENAPAGAGAAGPMNRQQD